MYPDFTVVDNFLDDPEYAVELANRLEYNSNDEGRWPGTRSSFIHEVDPEFFQYVYSKIFSIFYESEPTYWEGSLNFQKITPYHFDQYDKKNMGWVHIDGNPKPGGIQFGGIIYLDKNPENDTGTSMYTKKDDSVLDQDHNIMKENLYLNKLHSDEAYYEAYDLFHKPFTESVTVKNRYNRMVMIDGNTFHAAQTFGTKERLTLCFFGHTIEGKTQPMLRYR